MFYYLLPGLIIAACVLQSLVKQGTGISKLQVFAVVIDMTDISQGKNRFTAISFTSSHRGNRPGRCDGRLGGIPDAKLFNAW